MWIYLKNNWVRFILKMSSLKMSSSCGSPCTTRQAMYVWRCIEVGSCIGKQYVLRTYSECVLFSTQCAWAVLSSVTCPIPQYFSYIVSQTHILRWNCLLKQVIEGKIKGEMEVTRRLGRRRGMLLDDLKDRRGYSHLKEEAVDRTVWRNRFGGGFGPVVGQNTGWVNEWMNEWMNFINGTILEYKVLNVIYVFRFSRQLLSETFLI